MQEHDYWVMKLQGLWPLAGDGRECFVEVCRLRHGDRQDDEAEAGRQLLLLQLEGGKRSNVIGVVDDADPLDPWIELLEQLETLGADSFRLVNHAGNVTARPRERGW